MIGGATLYALWPGVERRQGTTKRPIMSPYLRVLILLLTLALVAADDLMAQGEAIPSSELRVLPQQSVPALDRILSAVERAYASMDVDQFVAFFSDDFVQLDPNRRVRVEGRGAWRDQTRRIIGAHRSMGRLHYGRLWLDPWLIVELEWWGTVRGEALGHPGEDREYRYSGLGLVEIQDGRITRQILWGDYATLQEQLGL